MRRICSIFAVTFASLAMSPLASAGEISATVEPVLANVSLSVGAFETLASYRITLTNSGTASALNRPRLVATTSVTGGNVGAKATFKTVTGAVCTTTNDGTSIDCTIGSLAPGATSAPFTVTFAAPTSGTDITLAWQAVFDSGAPPGNSNGEVGSTAIILDPIDDNKVASDVPAGFALTIFTGSANAVPSSSDKAATKVAVPATAVATPATITETTFTLNCSNFKTCYESKISLPQFVGSYPATYLTITLRQDNSNIKNGTRIESVLIDYVDDANVLFPAIGDCPSPTTPRFDSVPCIAKRVYYKNKRVQGWTTGLDGDFEWTILNLKNGSFKPQ